MNVLLIMETKKGRNHAETIEIVSSFKAEEAAATVSDQVVWFSITLNQIFQHAFFTLINFWQIHSFKIKPLFRELFAKKSISFSVIMMAVNENEIGFSLFQHAFILIGF